MNELQQKSLDANLGKFCKDLSNTDMVYLTEFIIYDCYSEEPNKLASDFIDEFVGQEDWNCNLKEEITPPQYISKTTRNTQELIRIIRILLLEKSFHRFSKLTKAIPKVILNKEEKATLKGILKEHEARLSYQLEDEDSIRQHFDEQEGNELVELKRKEVDFIEKFGNLKFL